MKYLLKSRAGLSHVQTAVLVMVFGMIMSAVIIYTSILTVVQASRDQTQRVLDDYVMTNSIEIYNSIKNGDDFSDQLNKNFYKSRVFSAFSLDILNDALYSIDENGKVQYVISNPHVEYDVQNTLKLIAGYDLSIPIYFAGNHLFDLKMPIEVRTYYVLK